MTVSKEEKKKPKAELDYVFGYLASYLEDIIDKKTPLKITPDKRIRSFEEVNTGFSLRGTEFLTAFKEACRCIQCNPAPCIEGCPVKIEIPRFIQHLRNGNIEDAYKIIREKSNFPAICSRVCPREAQCEGRCVLNKFDAPIGIGALERFVGELASAYKIEENRIEEKKNKRIAIIGSGPAGLAASEDLALKGYDATVFESQPKPGGMLRYGIPRYRLPEKTINDVIKRLEKLGVEFRCSVDVGNSISLNDILKDYDSILIATGANEPVKLAVEGEDASGVVDALKFLNEVNSQIPVEDTTLTSAGKVIVVGGGFTALDAARSAMRLGAKEVVISYRRSEDEMPASADERNEAKEEGVRFQLQTIPITFITENGKLKKIKFIRTKLIEPDETGRKRPFPEEGTEFEVETDIAILATGAKPTLPKGIKQQKPYNKITLAGDVITGPSRVVKAMLDGKKAAQQIHEKLSKI